MTDVHIAMDWESGRSARLRVRDHVAGTAASAAEAIFRLNGAMLGRSPPAGERGRRTTPKWRRRWWWRPQLRRWWRWRWRRRWRRRRWRAAVRTFSGGGPSGGGNGRSRADGGSREDETAAPTRVVGGERVAVAVAGARRKAMVRSFFK